MKLHIGKDGFTLALELVTSTQAILARKRSGKSYTASVEAEELLEHKQQIAVIDPTGAWWGLRSSADGNGPGYPVVVFGGDHADAPLDFRAGKAMAAAIVEHGFSAIFDVGNFETDQQCQFVREFCGEMLRINRTAIHIFIDEADTFAAQKPKSSEQHKSGATVSRLVSQGGIRGLGVTMITQRSQKIDKDILTQVDMLTVLRMGHPLDIAPATDWITSEVNAEFAKEVKKELPRLPVGTAFFCSATREIGERVEVRARRTFNSGATPKPGERKAEPKVLAKIDIEKLGKEISASVQKVREESPEFLKKRIAELEKGQKPTTLIAPERERMLLEQINTLEANLNIAKRTAGAYEKAMDGIYGHAGKMQDAATAIKGIVDGVRQTLKDAPQAAALKPVANTPQMIVRSQPVRSAPRTEPSGDLNGPEQRIVNSIAWFHALGIEDPEKAAVAFMAGYTFGSGGFNNPCGSLNGKGLIKYLPDNRIKLTEEGNALAIVPDIPGTDEALHDAVLGKLGGPEQRILQPLLKSYPHGMDNLALAAASGYAPGSGGYNNPRGRLKSLGLIRYESGVVYANSLLFPES